MEYTKSIINKFFSLLKKRKCVYRLKELNGFVISLNQLHLLSNACGDYRNVWGQILLFLLEKHWYSKFDEFCIINGFKNDVDAYLQEHHHGTMKKTLNAYFGDNAFNKWDSFVKLSVLFGMKNFSEIHSKWTKYAITNFKYVINV